VLSTLGDTPGHEFHGNQWTTGIVSVGDRQLTVTLPAQAAARGDKLVSVNVAAFDKAFAKDAGFYLDAKGSNRIGQRYDRVKEFIKTSHTIEASQVTVDKEGHVRFTDGRHRYAALRDSGATKIPLAMDRESQRNAKQFGLTIRALQALLLLTAHRNVRMRQAGDVPGHEFHGNQWTGSIGDIANSVDVTKGPVAIGSIKTTVHRVGPSNESEVYFAGTHEDALAYAGLHAGHEVKAYPIETKNTLVAVGHHQLYAHLNPGKNLNDAIYKADKASFKSTGGRGDSVKAFRDVQRKMMGQARKAGYDSILFKAPPAPAKSELVLLKPKLHGLAAIDVSKRDLTPLHKAADAHYASIMLAVSAAFMRGKKALRASLRGAEFNPDEPRDEKGQWTSGGVQPEEKAIAERLGLPTTYSGTDSMTSLSGRLNPESARAYFAGKAVDNPIPKNKTLTMEQAQRLPIMMSGETKEVSIAPLRSTQDYIQPSAVEKYKNGEGMTSRPVVATIHGEEVLLNGNHNVLAAQLRGQDTIKVQHLGDFSKHADYIKKVDAQGGGFTSLSASPNISAAVSAIRASLVHDLPAALEKAYVAGGGTVGGLKAAGDVEGHEFHGNQYTHGASLVGGHKLELTERGNISYVHVRYKSGSASSMGRVEKHGNEHHAKAEDVPIGTFGTKAEAVKAVLERSGFKTLGDVEGHPFHGNQYTTVYHGTTQESAAKIAKEGLNPDKSGVVFATESYDKAAEFAKNLNYPDPTAAAVVTLRIPKLGLVIEKPLTKGRKDPVGTRTVRIVGRVAPEHVMNVRHLATKFKTQFDAKNSNAATWALTHATQIADDISQTSKDNIALAVARAQEEGDLQEQYDEILDAVGDEARASLIARTESMTAVNEGQRDAWDQALEKGLLTEDNRVVWIATSDACPECEELDGEERTLDGEYPGDGGDGPPLHPNCRCTEGIVG
jgi:hypothetical protein